MTANRKQQRAWWAVWLILLVGVAGGTAWYWQRPQNHKPQYRTARVVSGDLVQQVTASGQLNPVIKVLVGSQISGTIQKLFVDYNSIVTNNQVIAQLDAATYLAAVHQNEGELHNATAALELAQLNAKRAKELFAKAIMSEQEYNSNTIALHQAEANVEIKQSALEKSKVDLARCTIYSPVDGIVIARNVDVGQTVAASLSAPTLFEIANNLAQMQIDAYVSEADIGSVEVGQQVNFTVDAFPNRTFQGKVAQVRNAATTVQNVVTYDTVIEVNNRDLKLRPGMTANVAIIAAQRQNVLKIPNAAFRYRPPDAGGAAQAPVAVTTAKTVFILPPAGNGETPRRPVAVDIKAGISDGAVTEILEGLKEGDEVVIGMAQAASSATVDMTRANNPIAGTPSRPPPK
ncbi:MAG: efflux RND transporter periplasmic adaptor subunit [Verrucomicrobia bacterium]|nr:efflux RND transporter periplasmic adaptor subunit [Verrucomicrobiota bacterium]